MLPTCAFGDKSRSCVFLHREMSADARGLVRNKGVTFSVWKVCDDEELVVNWSDGLCKRILRKSTS